MASACFDNFSIGAEKLGEDERKRDQNGDFFHLKPPERLGRYMHEHLRMYGVSIEDAASRHPHPLAAQ